MDFFKQHRSELIQITTVVLALFVLDRAAGFLPEPINGVLKGLVWVCALSVLTLAIIFLGFQTIHNFRFERTFTPNNLSLRRPPLLENFTIANPLNRPGQFRKAQLHVHTSLSYDSKTPPDEVVQSYIRDGYSFIAITDHDRYGDLSHLSTPECMVIPGIEATIPALFWPIPLGKHLIMINPPPDLSPRSKVQTRIDRVEQYGGITIPAHLSWRGGAGTGRWYPAELAKLTNLNFVEIENHYSRDPLDFIIWHRLNLKAGWRKPVWGVAVDDSHHGSSQSGWVMVKTERITLADLVAALKSGAFYATNGPLMEVDINDTIIQVSAPGAAWIRFYDASNHPIGVFRSEQAAYPCHGDEGFVRVEVTNHLGRTAWSQPFWLITP